MMQQTTEEWNLWYPKAAATGLPFARGRVAGTDVLLVHAAPPVLTISNTEQQLDQHPNPIVHELLGGELWRNRAILFAASARIMRGWERHHHPQPPPVPICQSGKVVPVTFSRQGLWPLSPYRLCAGRYS